MAPSSVGGNSSPLHDSQGVDELATLDRYHHFRFKIDKGLQLPVHLRGAAVNPRIPGGCDPLHFNIRGYT